MESCVLLMERCVLELRAVFWSCVLELCFGTELRVVFWSCVLKLKAVFCEWEYFVIEYSSLFPQVDESIVTRSSQHGLSRMPAHRINIVCVGLVNGLKQFQLFSVPFLRVKYKDGTFDLQRV